MIHYKMRRSACITARLLMFISGAFFMFSTLFSSMLAAENLAFNLALAKTLENRGSALAFYQDRGFAPIWAGMDAPEKARRSALIRALENADTHGLPSFKYGLNRLLALARSAKSQQDLGVLEGQMTLSFLRYAADVHTGLVVPGKVDANIFRKVKYLKDGDYLNPLASMDSNKFFTLLPPQTDNYRNLLAARQDFLTILKEGGWGPKLVEEKLRPGERSQSVVALRNRLIEQGYLRNTLSDRYGKILRSAVQSFQKDHGLSPDGVAGPLTLAELNVPVKDRLKAISVAMERERWVNGENWLDLPKSARQVQVNLTDFSAKILDDDVVVFETRSVIGANDEKRRSPEFSDRMEHMVVNPTWNVPRSITVGEYLPELQLDPFALSELTLINPEGESVDRFNINFNDYTEENFPYDLKQKPSQRNALGLVKFMFPNPHNIYLHDTPQKSLFSRDERAFSHGCIRLHQPFDFAYALLAKQTSTPKKTFQTALDLGEENIIFLRQPVPVHIIYRTAVTGHDGRIGFRRDIYGRDAQIFAALQKAGVVITSNQG